MPLRENKLWERVKGLVGETVYTHTTQNPNKIIQVTANRVEIEGRKSKIYRREILRVYEILLRDSQVTGISNLPSWYVIMPILQSAVPEEIEKTGGGIKLRGQKYGPLE